MEVELIFVVDKVAENKLYSGEIQNPKSGIDLKKTRVFQCLILAQNSNDAMSKLQAYMAQESPSLDLDSCAVRVKLEYVIA